MLRVVASSGFVVQVAATANGLHQLLLSCVADTHALLALKAFQPSQRAPTPNLAQVARTDHRQARTAARVARAAAKCPGDKTVGKTTLGAAETSVTLKDRGDKLLALTLICAAGVQLNTGASGAGFDLSIHVLVLLRWLMHVSPDFSCMQ